MINHHKMKNKRYFYRNNMLVQQHCRPDEERKYRLLVEMLLPHTGLSNYSQYYRNEPTSAELRDFANEAKEFFDTQRKEHEEP